MGADIYLESIHDVVYAEWEPKFRAACAKRDLHHNSEMSKMLQADVDLAYEGMYSAGYFRDNYNGYGLFSQINLSWWQDVIPMLDEKNYLPIDRARELREMVAKAKFRFTNANKVARQRKDSEPEEGWRTFYERDRQKLLDILDKSIELEEPLRCSL